MPEFDREAYERLLRRIRVAQDGFDRLRVTVWSAEDLLRDVEEQQRRHRARRPKVDDD